MSLRWRTLLVISAVFVGLSVVLYGAARAILLNSLAGVEEENSRRNMGLVLDLLSSESANLDIEAGDWAAWDESHAFVENGNPEFSKRNLTNTTFYELNLNLIIFVRASGPIIFEKGFDREKKAEVPVPDGFRKHLSPDGPLLRNATNDVSGDNGTTGVILLEEGSMLVAARSITSGGGNGPAVGKLIMGRFLGASFTKRLMDITHLSVSLEKFGTSAIPAELASRLSDPSAQPILTRTDNKNSIESLAVVKDIYGDPVLMVHVQNSRDIYRLGEAGLRYLFVALVSIGLAFLVAALWLLEKLILSRVLRLSRAVNDIAAGMHSDMRVSVTGKDDLSQLASDINGMIDALASSQRERRDALLRFESVVENTPLVAIQGIDRNGVVEVWNETSSVLYGFGEAEALGRRLQDLVMADAAAGEFILTIEEVCDTGRAAAPREWEVKTREGGTRWVYSSMFPVSQRGEAANVFCMAVDITDRKHSEQALKESEEFLRVIFESAHMGILIVDMDNHSVTSANPAAAAMIGAEPEKIVGRSVHQLICPPYEEECYIDDSGTEMDNSESIMMRSDGKHVPILKTAVAATLHGRRQLIESFIDISERKRTEEKLEAANRELEELNHELERTIEHAQKLAIRAQMASMSKSDFLARMSHEIRTPMSAVIGFTDLLADTRLMDEQREYVETIRRSGETLLSLINDILDLSRIEAGQLILESVDFDPEVIACDVCELMLSRVKGKPVEILCRIGGTVPSLVKGDPNRFRQVLLNLMGNAVKFTESGEIELSLEIEEEKDGQVLLHGAVRDTGIGIPEGKLGRIFEAFQQSDSFITRKYGGSGLGLTICRQLSSLMGGTVRVQSKPGEGSVFHFTCRLGKIGQADEGTGVLTPLARKKVLLMDANSASLDICAGILRSAGARVVGSRLDADFLSIMKTAFHAGEPFHLCIVNIPMPGACGYDVAKLVREDDSPVSSLPLLACSCAVEPGYRRSMEAGFSGFLPKPSRRKNLVEAATELLAGRRGGITAPREETNVGADQGEVELTKREVRILLAEDNPANQRLARLILLKEGYEVEVASNGTEAVRMFTSQPDRYHVILMDVQMPEMDGMSAAKAIRAKGFGRIPIIAMTANAMKGDREKCLEAGMNDYFPKPIRREAVSKIVEKWAATEDRG